MARFTRRNFLKLSGGGAVAARTGGLAAILASGQTPAFAQATTIHWLRWVDFVPSSDEVLRKEIVPECQKALGITLNLETINGNDIQARTTAAIQSGSGPDVVCGLNNWPQLYADSIVDVSDLADEIGKAQGGYYDESRVVANDGKKWVALPWCVLGAMIAYRKSWLAEVGYAEGKFPQTWEEYHAAGKKLKAAGHPIGQTLGHTFGDAPTFTYPYLWSWGGKEAEKDGKTVALDSKAPPYSPHRNDPHPGDNIGLTITDLDSGRSAFYAPGLGGLTLFRGITEIILPQPTSKPFPTGLTHLGVLPIPGTQLAWSFGIFLRV